MGWIDDAGIRLLRLATRPLLTYSRFWVLILAEAFKRQPAPTAPPTDSTRPPIRLR